MIAKTMHMNFEVAYCIRLLEDVPYEKRDLKWAEQRTQFENLKKHGYKVVSFCPTPVEESPNIWKCPGHPVSPKREAELKANIRS